MSSEGPTNAHIQGYLGYHSPDTPVRGCQCPQKAARMLSKGQADVLRGGCQCPLKGPRMSPEGPARRHKCPLKGRPVSSEGEAIVLRRRSKCWQSPPGQRRLGAFQRRRMDRECPEKASRMSSGGGEKGRRMSSEGTANVLMRNRGYPQNSVPMSAKSSRTIPTWGVSSTKRRWPSIQPSIHSGRRYSRTLSGW